MKKGKKFLNNPKQIVDQALEGLVAANSGMIRRLEGTNERPAKTAL